METKEKLKSIPKESRIKRPALKGDNLKEGFESYDFDCVPQAELSASYSHPHFEKLLKIEFDQYLECFKAYAKAHKKTIPKGIEFKLLEPNDLRKNHTASLIFDAKNKTHEKFIDEIFEPYIYSLDTWPATAKDSLKSKDYYELLNRSEKGTLFDP